MVVTRARCQTVVFLPGRCWAPCPGSWTTRGLAYMRNLVELAAGQNPPVSFDVGEGVRASLLRADQVLG